jgi:proteasome assembly chaperone (PAC2) family protein
VGLVTFTERPELERPVLLAAFAGWNDAGEAATTALVHLSKVLGARPFAAFDPEEFFDFTVQRPEVRLTPDGSRRVQWPAFEFAAARLPGAGRDAVVLRGIEPHLRWRTFVAELLGLARELGVELVVTLGALLADVAHSRPVRVTGSATGIEDPGLGLAPSRYEGPTGIVGVLHDACATVGLPSVSLWASVPHYVGQSPSPKAALALVRRVASLLRTEVDTAPLEEAAAAYERHVAELVAADPEVAAYVARLEQEADASGTDGGGPAPSEGLAEDVGPTGAAGEKLAEEAERYLREQRRD